nr:YicC/YloC family endoribonuclease [Marinicella sp. W31]MDC2876884.1 YicC family protein [Marinicella sp. W31]
MKPQSMTGFARSDGHWQRYRWSWELRSVNGKGLDYRIRLPSGCDQLEAVCRKKLAAALSRGNVQATLSLTLAESRLELVVNDAALKAVVDLKARLGDLVDDSRLSLEALLSLRGVADFREVEESDAVLDERDQMILSDLDVALERLCSMRGEEGEKIAVLLGRQVDRMAELTAMIAADPSREPSAIAARLREQVEKLVDAGPSLDAERLYAEAVLLATKADIQEEVDRLQAHVEAARKLLSEGGPCGRRLDFLAQEFNRETNTVCSKSNAVAVTAAGLELKTVIDQFREQIQNLE